MQSKARRHSETSTERWPSGRRRSPAKGVYRKRYRGFESLLLRHPFSAIQKHEWPPEPSACVTALRKRGVGGSFRKRYGTSGRHRSCFRRSPASRSLIIDPRSLSLSLSPSLSDLCGFIRRLTSSSCRWRPRFTLEQNQGCVSLANLGIDSDDSFGLERSILFSFPGKDAVLAVCRRGGVGVCGRAFPYFGQLSASF